MAATGRLRGRGRGWKDPHPGHDEDHTPDVCLCAGLQGCRDEDRPGCFGAKQAESGKQRAEVGRWPPVQASLLLS